MQAVKSEKDKAKQEPTLVSYQEKYNQLKTMLLSTYQYSARYALSEDTLLINPKKLDQEIQENKTSYKQAYFNLLTSCYDKSKTNSLCLALININISPQLTSNDIQLLQSVPPFHGNDAPISFLAPYGLHQGNWRILTTQELKDLGLDAYLERAKDSNNNNQSIKQELKTNGLLYKLDKKIKEKYPTRTILGQKIAFHTLSATATSERALLLINNALGDTPLILSMQFKNLKIDSPCDATRDEILEATLLFEELLEKFDPKDRFFICLFTEASSFLGPEKIENYKKRIQEEGEENILDLIRDIEIDIYHHSKDKPEDKHRCNELLYSYLTIVEKKLYESNSRLQLPVTKEEYISYTMEQLIENQKNHTHAPSFYQLLRSLREVKSPELTDFTYEPLQNQKALADEGIINDRSFNNWLEEGEKETTYIASSISSKEWDAFQTLLTEQNPVIVNELQEKYKAPETTEEEKALIRQFTQDLDAFERDINRLQIQAALLQDDRIAIATKLSYYQKFQPSYLKERRKNLLSQHDNLKLQAEKIFPPTKKSKALSAVLLILGAALVIIGVVLALLSLPVAAFSSITLGIVALGAGAGTFFKQLKSETRPSSVSRFISQIHQRWEQSITKQEQSIIEKKDNQDNCPSTIFSTKQTT